MSGYALHLFTFCCLCIYSWAGQGKSLTEESALSGSTTKSTDKAKTTNQVSVVSDQTGSPTYTRDLAVLLVDMMETNRYGVYHATNEGICNWYEFAKEIFAQAGIDMEVTPISSDQYPAKATRPHNSRMNKDKLEEKGFRRLPPWQDALKRYLEIIRG